MWSGWSAATEARRPLFVSHARVTKVSFTASIPAGKKIQQTAGHYNQERGDLELGGHSPAVVFDDCKVDVAVTRFANALAASPRQVRFAATGVYVQKVSLRDLRGDIKPSSKRTTTRLWFRMIFTLLCFTDISDRTLTRQQGERLGSRTWSQST